MPNKSSTVSTNLISTKRRQSWWLIKGIILIGFTYLFYHQIIGNSQLDSLVSTFRSRLSTANWWLLISVIGLMPVNWVLESLKWRRYFPADKAIRPYQSIDAVLCGLSVGIITPQRIGEYGGRAIALSPSHRWSSVFATFYSSLAQNLSNLVFGIVGSIIFLSYYLGVSHYLTGTISVISTLVILLIIAAYYHLPKLISILPNWLMDKVITWTGFHPLSQSQVHAKDLNYGLSLAIWRTAIYIMQYGLILYFFGINAEILALISGIATIYLVQSSVPLPPLFGILARGEIALLVWSVFDANELSILAATFGLWIINLVVPAMIGMIILMKKRVE